MGMGAFADKEWDSLCKMFSLEEPDFEAQIHVAPPSIDNNTRLSNNPPNTLLSLNNQFNCSSQDSSTPSYDFPFHMPSYYNYHLLTDSHLALPNDPFLSTNFSAIENATNDTFFTSIFLHDMANKAVVNADGSSSSSQTSISDDCNQLSPLGYSPLGELKRKYSTPEREPETALKSGSLATPKKKARASIHIKAKKSVQLKEIEDLSDEDTTKAGLNSERASGEISEDGSNASQEASEGENSMLKGKKRASRGAATDPQSLYARRRRERINERLKILQNLVPNGTKVDISTMLEEAVQYVKFLQLQIRLLSSDDLWMYAPIAYNGVDISLYRRISPFLLP